ncbi:hypothetical protein EOE48_12385 [Methylobacterium oryzihabitans]|uniref:Uncharacterized protein n=1 Tax=Methylobacterium oryzihabitans TaxID=2499852 RepID=A0A437P7A7_9HYPH|nr:hypothetical protein EOE48_12385 [Methylobacterium oryzihabitans]
MRGEGFVDLAVNEARRQPMVRGRGRRSLLRNHPLTLAPAGPALASSPTRGMKPSPRPRGEEKTRGLREGRGLNEAHPRFIRKGRQSR